MTCFTIGHSNHSIKDFVTIVKNNHINCIIDVRSSPYSAYSSQFNREYLNEYLKRESIRYIFMGDSLGARYENKNLLFSNGKVDFSKVRLTQEFINGIKRVIDGLQKGFRIALMCSEKNPFDCHRFVLVSKGLQDEGIEIQHILPERIVSNIELEDMLFEKYKISKCDLFHTEKENLELVYKKRNADIGYNALTKEGDEE